MFKIIYIPLHIITLFVILISHSVTAENSAPIIQPGAPGESSKNLDAEAATAIADSSYTKADVNFLQGMIVHHQQAIVMSALAPKRTNNKTILDLALRIDVSQEDEINFMESWLKARNENVPDLNEMHGMHAMNGMHMHLDMVGMATPKQLEDLRNSKSTDFDRLFLQLMITHHDGALEMVKDLKGFVGSTYDPVLNEFVADLVNDQGVEIERMNAIAVVLSDDPRAGLAPGLFTADEAILNMELITSLRKPTGFF